MPSPSCIQSSARNVVTGLLDSNQPSPVSSGVGAQATQTLLGRSAQMAYHYTIRPYGPVIDDRRTNSTQSSRCLEGLSSLTDSVSPSQGESNIQPCQHWIFPKGLTNLFIHLNISLIGFWTQLRKLAQMRVSDHQLQFLRIALKITVPCWKRVPSPDRNQAWGPAPMSGFSLYNLHIWRYTRSQQFYDSGLAFWPSGYASISCIMQDGTHQPVRPCLNLVPCPAIYMPL